MRELISIKEHGGQSVVSARDLYDYLDIGRDFSSWCKQMFDYGFEEKKDFSPILGKSTGGRPSVDYALTMDCAKEIAMIQRSDKGKAAREYFIACEKRLRSNMSTLDIMEMSIQKLRDHEAKIKAIRNDVDVLKAQRVTRPDYFTIAGYGTITGVRVNIKLASHLGRAATKLCNDMGYPIDSVNDPRFGKVNMYPGDVLKEVFATTKL